MAKRIVGESQNRKVGRKKEKQNSAIGPLIINVCLVLIDFKLYYPQVCKVNRDERFYSLYTEVVCFIMHAADDLPFDPYTVA